MGRQEEYFMGRHNI
jgi:hypothetical protein